MPLSDISGREGLWFCGGLTPQCREMLEQWDRSVGEWVGSILIETKGKGERADGMRTVEG